MQHSGYRARLFFAPARAYDGAMATQTPILHYIFDPLCGWCYGAAPLVEAARGIPGLTVMPHGGGMMTGGNRQPVTDALRRYVMPHDERIAGMTGQVFGPDYFDGLLRDSGAVFDSEPPTTAILAAQALAGRGLDLLRRLQQAHYVQGLRIADPAVLKTLAAEIGLDAEAYAAAYAAAEGAATAAHIADSRKLLARVGGTGFPTLALERDGICTLLEPSRYLGRPEQWQAHLRERIQGQA
ncbi:DSBA-like thioredoxin domain protein [compost metagenome]